MHFLLAGEWIDNNTGIICLNFKHVVLHLVDSVGKKILKFRNGMLDELLGNPLGIS